MPTLLKADEDTFVNLEELMKELEKWGPDLYLGYFTGRARVKRSGPWAEPKWLSCDYYLPNARGGGYVLGKDNVDFIANNVDRYSTHCIRPRTGGVYKRKEVGFYKLLNSKKTHDLIDTPCTILRQI